MSAASTTIQRRAYFADTDAGGVVYHGAYVAWFEQARCEWLLERDSSVAQWLERGMLFVVASIQVDYLASVRIDETVEVQATLARQGNSTAVFEHEVRRAGELVCRASVRLVCLDRASGRPVRIPQDLMQAGG